MANRAGLEAGAACNGRYVLASFECLQIQKLRCELCTGRPTGVAWHRESCQSPLRSPPGGQGQAPRRSNSSALLASRDGPKAACSSSSLPGGVHSSRLLLRTTSFFSLPLKVRLVCPYRLPRQCSDVCAPSDNAGFRAETQENDTDRWLRCQYFFSLLKRDASISLVEV